MKPLEKKKNPNIFSGTKQSLIRKLKGKKEHTWEPLGVAAVVVAALRLFFTSQKTLIWKMKP